MKTEGIVSEIVNGANVTWMLQAVDQYWKKLKERHLFLSGVDRNVQ